MLVDRTIRKTVLAVSSREWKPRIAQTSIWIWSNALYYSMGKEIFIAQITILQLLFTNQIKPNVGFWWEGKTGVPGEKPLLAEERTNKLNPHMTPSAENRTRATLVEGKCSHHQVNPATKCKLSSRKPREPFRPITTTDAMRGKVWRGPVHTV